MSVIEGNNVDLRETITLLLNYKILVLCIVLLAVICGGTYYYLSPKQYEIVSQLRVGRYLVHPTISFAEIELKEEWNLKLVENPRNVGQEVKSLAVAIASQKNYKSSISSQLIQNIKINSSSEILDVRITAEKKDIYLKFLQEIYSRILEDHNRIIQAQKDKINNKINMLQGKLEKYQHYESLFRQGLNSEIKSKSQAGLLDNLYTVEQNILEAKNKLQDLQSMRNNITPSRLILEPTFGKNQSRSPLLVIGISLLIGLIFSILVVFTYHALKMVKNS